MSDKQELIKKLLEMQKKFIQLERERGIGMEEYFTPGEDDPLYNYREEYLKTAMKIVELAHEEKGSHQ